jgi:hypothetical protein
VKGFLLFVVGVVVGILLLAAFQVFVIPPPPLSQTGTGPPDLVILFRNEFLTRELQRQAATIQSPVPLENLVVSSSADHNLEVGGSASVPNTGIAVPVRITLHPTVHVNRVVVQVVKVDVGTLTVPGQFLHALEDPINRELNRSLVGTPFEILAVSTTPEGLIVDVAVRDQR